MGKKHKKASELVPAGGPPDTMQLLSDLRTLIDAGRAHVAQAVDAGLVLLYWGVGERIRREILHEQRAAYGEPIVLTVSRQLAVDYGCGFSRPNLFQMIRFAETFADRTIVATLSQQLGWSHFIEIIRLRMRSSVTSTPRCAGWSAGASGRCGPRSAACSLNAQPSPKSQKKSPGAN